VTEEEPVDLVRIGVLQMLSDFKLVPFWQPGIKHTMGDDVRNGLVIRMPFLFLSVLQSYSAWLPYMMQMRNYSKTFA
jgi:hypothetical protein